MNGGNGWCDMPKKAHNKGGRPCKPADEKLSVLYGVRFTPSDAAEIKKATYRDESLVGRIRNAILKEVRKTRKR